MRQKKIFKLRINSLLSRIALFAVIFVLAGTGTILADITAISKCEVKPSEGDPTKDKYNAGITVTISAEWTGDTKPFGATFKMNDVTIGNENTDAVQASVIKSGADIGHGDGKNFSVTVIETSVPNAKPLSKTGDHTLNMDLVPPNVVVTLKNGPNFSNKDGSNIVNFEVTCADEDLDTFTPQITPDPGTAAALDTTQSTAKRWVYSINKLQTAQPGAYTIKAVCKDKTLPAAYANSGSGQTSFNVVTVGPGAPAINTVLPAAVTKSQNITLSGTCPTTVISIAVFENGTELQRVTPTADKWTISLTSVAEGKHTYTVQGKDTLGNDSTSSPEFSVTVDLHAPDIPELDQPVSPTSKKTITLTGKKAVDQLSNGVNALPVIVQLYDLKGTQVASVTANSDGSFTFPEVKLDNNGVQACDNIFYVKAEDSAHGSPGNQSGGSASIVVKYDPDAATTTQLQIARALSLASQTLPLPATTWIGPGNYYIQVNFSEDMDKTVFPSIGLKPVGGTEVITTGGTWINSTMYVGQIAIPKGQGTTYNGMAAIRVSGAKDLAGNTMLDVSEASAFNIDTSAPITTMASMDIIYLSAANPKVTITGTSDDQPPGTGNNSGVGWLEIATQTFAGGPIGTATVPFFNGTTVSWSYTIDSTTWNPGKYKLWAYAADQAKPDPNIEERNTAGYRIVIVDKTVPIVNRISFDDVSTDISTPPDYPPPMIASPVTKLTAVITKTGDSPLNLNVPPFVFTLTHVPTNTTITGNYTNNASDTIYMTFPQLTQNGTYSIKVVPVDLAGNVGLEASRTFVLDTAAPDNVTLDPPQESIVNDTSPPISHDEVWARIQDTFADYASSTIEVSYNGTVVGSQTASTTDLVWNLYGTAATCPKDQSADGRYDVVVVPKDVFGNIGTTKKFWFKLDTQGPVVTKAEPASATWVGLGSQNLTVSVSDAPKDITTVISAPVAGDSSWQNGNGAGVDPVNSTFSVTLDTTTTYATSKSATSMSVPKPSAPVSTVGIASLSMLAELRDCVNKNSANSRQTGYTIFYDYLRPQFTFHMPVTTKKYCKTSINCGGEVQDRGTSIDAYVNKAEISADGTNWTSVTCEPTLPSKLSSWTYKMDISAWKDGTHIIYGHCYDRGNNESATSGSAAAGEVTQLAIVVDRTPPASPTLILPLNDSVTKTKGQRFRWSTVTATDSYIIQIADDSSFNNILNSQSNSTVYSGLIGQITTTPEASFSVPKDGTYYWRVGTLEACEDGYNFSGYSTAWHFTVDTVRPRVVEVLPSPSTSNKVTTGMVTFTIHFSEANDNTVPPTVILTSAGGQAMKVEQVTYKDDIWTGTTIIPKDNSALYDGNAVISISGAKDLAGNEMETDSTNQVVINTGPAFETMLFSNPAHEFEITVVTRSTEALQGPPTCSITQGTARVPVVMNFLKERYYAGAYTIDQTISGKAYIDLTGTDLYGMTGRGSVEFTVANVTPTSRVVMKSDDDLATLDIASGSVSKATSIYMISRKNLDSSTNQNTLAKILPSIKTRVTAVSQSDSELIELSPLEEIGPSNLKLTRKMWYLASIKDIGLTVAKDKVHVYRQDGDKWIFCGGTIKNNYITAQIGGLGNFSLMADVKPPQSIRLLPTDKAKLDDPAPLIEGSFADEGSGLSEDLITLSIDGQVQSDVKLDSSGNFSYQVKKPLAKGDHQIEVAVSDLAGNTTRAAFSVTAPGPFAIDQLVSYPNPSRGDAVWFNYNIQQKADEIKLKITDSSGDKVAEFDSMDFSSLGSGKIRWDLTNEEGKKVSNGVYFYKMEATKNGKTFKARGKLAVLR